MAVRTREELMEQIRGRVGDNTDDETIAFLEDVQDTFADMESRANPDGKDWKAEAERIDQEWRTKYRERFFGGVDDNEPDDTNHMNSNRKKTYNFEDLFKEG